MFFFNDLSIRSRFRGKRSVYSVFIYYVNYIILKVLSIPANLWPGSSYVKRDLSPSLSRILNT